MAGIFTAKGLFFYFKLAKRLNTAFCVENVDLCEESRHRVYAYHMCDESFRGVIVTIALLPWHILARDTCLYLSVLHYIFSQSGTIRGWLLV